MKNTLLALHSFHLNGWQLGPSTRDLGSFPETSAQSTISTSRLKKFLKWQIGACQVCKYLRRCFWSHFPCFPKNGDDSSIKICTFCYGTLKGRTSDRWLMKKRLLQLEGGFMPNSWRFSVIACLHRFSIFKYFKSSRFGGNGATTHSGNSVLTRWVLPISTNYPPGNESPWPGPVSLGKIFQTWGWNLWISMGHVAPPLQDCPRFSGAPAIRACSNEVICQSLEVFGRKIRAKTNP